MVAEEEKTTRSFAHVIFAFDLEYTGKVPVGLGCSVQNEHREELDSLLLKGYLPGITLFEEKCQKRFWDQKPELLQLLTCDQSGIKTTDQVEDYMLDRFAVFYIKWEQYAVFQEKQFHLVSDNKSYDGGIINELFKKWGGKMEALPYRLYSNTYGTFWETHSMQKQLLYSLGIKDDWNLPEKIRELFELEKSPYQADSNPVNDARTIAVEYSDLLKLGPPQIRAALTKLGHIQSVN